MKNTLKEILEQNKWANEIILIFGDHVITVYADKKGSAAILTAFYDRKFDTISIEPNAKRIALEY